MSQSHGHLRASDGQLQPSTFSTRSDYGSGFGPDSQQAAGSYGSNDGYAAPVPAHGSGGSMGVGHPRVALPANVRYPPSMVSTYQPRHTPQQMYMVPQPGAVAVHPPPASSSISASVAQAHFAVPVTGESGGVGVVSDVIRQLDLAADENNRLRSRLQDNNRILEEKVQEIQKCLTSRDRERQDLQTRITHLEGKLREENVRRERETAQRKSMPTENTVDETTNKLFEAQVAVMGFKCRVMQLQGELDDLHKEERPDAGARQEIERLSAENATLREDLVQSKRERETARPAPQAVSLSARTEQAMRLRLQELSDLSKSQELVIREVNQQLSDKRALFTSETQRMSQQSQQLQAEIQRLREELTRVQNQLASHQQSSDQQLTSLTTQLNMARQQQARSHELGKQLSVAHAEISRLNSDLSQAMKEAEKFKKKSETFETKVKDSAHKMMSMQDQMKGPQKTTGPVPKPRGDLTQLKTEREQLETELATVRSNLDRESRARQGAESELQEERKKLQAVMMKNNQLLSQLTGGREGGGAVGVAEERQQLERSVSESEERVREREAELQRIQLEMERIQREKTQAEANITRLEKERKEAIDAKIEADSKLAAANEELITLRNSTAKTSSGKRKPTLEVRLNEYAGKLTNLEGRYEEAKADKARLQEQLDQEKRSVEDLEQRILELVREKGHLQGDTLRTLQQQKSEADRRLHDKENEVISMTLRHQEDLDRLRAEMSTQKQNYERKIQEKEAVLRSKEKDLESVQQSLQSRTSEKEGEVGILRVDLQSARTELQSKQSEIAQVRSELHSHATRIHELRTDTETLRANESQISTRLRETVRENDYFKSELANTQKVTSEYKKECQSLVADYQGAAKKIVQLEEERDRYRNQASMGMRELAQRGERVKALEGERQTLQDQLMHMDMQLKQYMADFRSEREMRESALQVKEMAERKQHELSTEVSTLQRQLTEIQTATLMNSDVDPSASVGGAMAGGGGGGGVPPDRWSGSSTGRHAPPVSHQTNERPVFPNTTDPPTSGVHAPPLPPKPGDYSARPLNTHIPSPQQYVGPGAASVLPATHHLRQELVTPGPQLHQVQPPVSQPPVAMTAGMGPMHNVAIPPRTRSGGPQYTPHTGADIDPHMRAGGGPNIPMDPHTRGSGMHMAPERTGGPGGGMHIAPERTGGPGGGMHMAPERTGGPGGGMRTGGPGGGMHMAPERTGGPGGGMHMAPERTGGPGGGMHMAPERTGGPGGGMHMAPERTGGPGVGAHPPPRQVPVSTPGPPRPLHGSEGGGNWVAPGDVVNRNRPEEACPLCGRDDFPTVTDLEIHCARCTGPT